MNLLNPFRFDSVTPPAGRAVYGYLYNWYAASDALFAPTDWVVPTKTHLDTLNTQISGAGGTLKETGLTHWNTPNSGATNTTGFTAFGSGYRNSTGSFISINETTWYVASNEFTSTSTWVRNLSYNSTSFNSAGGNHKKSGTSVRLLYTGAGTPTTVDDYDGNTYDVVLIGSQYWTVQNWKCTSLNDGTPLTKVTDAGAWAALTSEGYCAYGNNESYV